MPSRSDTLCICGSYLLLPREDSACKLSMHASNRHTRRLGSIVHLIDELFVECIYNRWSGVRPDKTRKDCVDFIMNLRSQGVVAHDWF